MKKILVLGMLAILAGCSAPITERITSDGGSLTRVKQKQSFPTPDGGDNEVETEHVSWTGDGYFGVEGNPRAVDPTRREPKYGRVGTRQGNWRPSYYGR